MAGERSGSLDEVIRRYVAYEKVIGAVKRRTISALIYPAILVDDAGAHRHHRHSRGAGVFQLYANFGRELPLSTRIIVGVSDFLTNLWLIGIGLVAIVISAVGWLAQPGQRTQIDRMLLRLPWAGETVRKFATSQFARTLPRRCWAAVCPW